ncbi:MAG: hypothetical protein PF694_02905 [Bacteroidetes bacterium]|jgi:hypothetical protein|nr:hypothetical protein [Bacteroidota bacterium]
MDRRIENPKDSNVYRNGDWGLNPTLKGSDVCRIDIARFHPTLKGSNVCKTDIPCFHTTLKGSNVCRTDITCFNTTPMGSNNSPVAFFYKHQIPSGLFADIKSENLETTNQNGFAVSKELK